MHSAPARVGLLFLFHAVVFTACYEVAWLLRFEFDIPPEFRDTVASGLPVVVGVQLLVGVLFDFYRGWWRYVDLSDVIRLVVGVTFALVVLLVAWYLGPLVGIPSRFVKSPRGVLLVDWSFVVLTLFGTRVVLRLGRDRLRGTRKTAALTRVLIIGAGDAGEALARGIENRPQLGMKVVAFVDDLRAKWGSRLRGVSVYGPISEVASIAQTHEAAQALIAIPSAPGRRLREIIHHLSLAGLEFRTIPGVHQIVGGKVEVTQLRRVNVEDLLRRERIDLPGDPVRALFANKNVLVTGAGGTIGSELSSQILRLEAASLTLVERSEYALYEVRRRLSREMGAVASAVTSDLLDIRDEAAVVSLLKRRKPHIVLHAAAHKHVLLGEENAVEYFYNNTLATRRLAELCAGAGVERFVFVSTDKAINPAGIMGATKRAAEILLVDLASQASQMKLNIVRFGNVIGSSGSVVPLFMEQIRSGGPVTVTHPEATRYFIRTSEAVALVLQAVTLGGQAQVFTLDMGEPIPILELARDLIRLSDHTEEEIPIVFIGMQKGEKLFEEIRLTGEAARPTAHPQIVITEAMQPDRNQVEAWLRQAAPANGEDVTRLLQTLVSDYKGPTRTSGLPVTDEAEIDPARHLQMNMEST
jgi:FlaA1/EpsC-like NDP-sugar epimerase